MMIALVLIFHDDDDDDVQYDDDDVQDDDDQRQYWVSDRGVSTVSLMHLLSPAWKKELH